MTTITDHDRDMIARAIVRGQVVVQHDQRTRLATLISWRPHHHGRRTRVARVQYPNGSYASVPCANITIPDNGEPCTPKN